MVSTRQLLTIPPGVPLPLDNGAVAARLDDVGDLLEGQGANPYRARAYHRAAATVRTLQTPLSEILHSEGASGLTELPGIGDSIARSVQHLLATGELPILKRLQGGRSTGAAVLTTVPGVGHKTAARIHAELGIETLADLEIAAYDGRLARLPGMGRKRLRAIRESLAGRFRRKPVLHAFVAAEAELQRLLSRNCCRSTTSIVGRRRQAGCCWSLRRGSMPQARPGCRFCTLIARAGAVFQYGASARAGNDARLGRNLP